MEPLFKPVNKLGRTGFTATALGIGDLADRRISIDDLVRTARRAIDAGLNIIDTAPMYEDGYSEEIVGRAVRGVRGRMFVIDKIDQLEEPAGPQVDASLQRLGLEYADLFVFHNLSSVDAWARITAPGGGMDQLRECRRAGKARFAGISSHDPATLRAAIPSGLCDVVMFPVGPFVDPSYVDEILPLARRCSVGTVCFKTFGAGKLVADTTGYNQPLQSRPRGKISSGGDSSEPQLPHLDPAVCVHYTLTCAPDVALLGLSFPNEQDVAFRAALEFRPLPPPRMTEMRNLAAAAVAGKGPCWWNSGQARS